MGMMTIIFFAARLANNSWQNNKWRERQRRQRLDSAQKFLMIQFETQYVRLWLAPFRHAYTVRTAWRGLASHHTHSYRRLQWQKVLITALICYRGGYVCAHRAHHPTTTTTAAAPAQLLCVSVTVFGYYHTRCRAEEEGKREKNSGSLNQAACSAIWNKHTWASHFFRPLVRSSAQTRSGGGTLGEWVVASSTAHSYRRHIVIAKVPKTRLKLFCWNYLCLIVHLRLITHYLSAARVCVLCEQSGTKKTFLLHEWQDACRHRWRGRLFVSIVCALAWIDTI